MKGWDQDLFWKMNRDWVHPVLDWLMPVLSAIDVWVPVLALVLVVYVWRMRVKGVVLLVALTLALAVSDGVVGKSLKSLIGRARPRDVMSEVVIRDVAKAKPRMLALFKPTVSKLSKVKEPATSGNSLPSNHTMNLFAAATVVALFYRRWGMALYLVAGLVAWSRVYVGAHWPSDLPPSAGLGLLIGLGAVWLTRRWFGLRDEGKLVLPE